MELDQVAEKSFLNALVEGGLVRTAEAMRHVGERLAFYLPINGVLALKGDLGAGKTTLVQGVARGWGIRGPVNSPTFAIFQLYSPGETASGLNGGSEAKGDDGEGASPHPLCFRPAPRQLCHVDAYRLTGPEAFTELLLDDLLEPPYGLVIEWPERLGNLLPPQAWVLEISLEGGPQEGVRRLRLMQSPGPRESSTGSPSFCA